MIFEDDLRVLSYSKWGLIHKQPDLYNVSLRFVTLSTVQMLSL